MTEKSDGSRKSQLDKFKQAARELETDDDPQRFKDRLKKLVKHNAVENSPNGAATGRERKEIRQAAESLINENPGPLARPWVLRFDVHRIGVRLRFASGVFLYPRDVIVNPRQCQTKAHGNEELPAELRLT